MGHDYLIEELVNDPLYDIREDGTVWTLTPISGRISADPKKRSWRKCGTTNHGYRLMQYKGKQVRIHRIIFRKHYGQLNPELEINHKDGNKSNNVPDNLEQITHSKNVIHVFKLGLADLSTRRKLSNSQVIELRELFDKGVTHRKLAKQFGISHATVQCIGHKKRYWPL